MSNQYQELKKQHYLGLLRECARSGKNKRAWCIEREIGYSPSCAGRKPCGRSWQGKSWPSRRSCRSRSHRLREQKEAAGTTRKKCPWHEMLGDIRRAKTIYIVSDYTDMRKGL